MTEAPAFRSAVVYDPDLAPPPDPRGDRRVMTILGVLTVVLIAGLGLGFYARGHASPKEIGAANAFLRDVRDHQFTAAYGRLCPSTQATTSEAKFTGPLQKAVAKGHGVSTFDIVSANTSQHVLTGSGSANVAQGTVFFADGKNTVVTILLSKPEGFCVLSGFDTLS
ncbi:MAG TPA: hypothetical protein VHX15_21995 [Frankiaceae bacterium]|nr:hypothetical protein [Frankiaceae bacterium]